MASLVYNPTQLRVARGSMATADVNLGTIIIPNDDARRIFILGGWLRAIGSAGAGTAITSVMEYRPNVVLSGAQNADYVTINDVRFTAHTNTTVIATHQFSISGSDTADGDQLCLCINDPTYGLRGLKATNAAGTVTIRGKSVANVTITSSNSTRAAVRSGGTAFITLAKAAISDGVIKRIGTANVTATNIGASPTTTYPIMIYCPTADLTTTTYLDYWVQYGVL